MESDSCESCSCCNSSDSRLESGIARPSDLQPTDSSSVSSINLGVTNDNRSSPIVFWGDAGMSVVPANSGVLYRTSGGPPAAAPDGLGSLNAADSPEVPGIALDKEELLPLTAPNANAAIDLSCSAPDWRAAALSSPATFDLCRLSGSATRRRTSRSILLSALLCASAGISLVISPNG